MISAVNAVKFRFVVTKIYDFNRTPKKCVRLSNNALYKRFSGGSAPAAVRYLVSFASGTTASIISRTRVRIPAYPPNIEKVA